MFGIPISEQQKKELGQLLENIIYVTDPEKIDTVIKLLYSINKNLEELNQVLRKGGDTHDTDN